MLVFFLAIVMVDKLLTDSPTKLAELMAARLCHDITGPLGAINNGIEFLGDEDGDEDMASAALDLIATSAKDAVNRILFYRTAYGAIKQHGAADIEQIKNIITNFLSQSKIEILWDKLPDSGVQTFTTEQARLLLNLVLIASGSLVRGGKLQIIFSPNIEIAANGSSIRFEEDDEKALSGEIMSDQLNARNVQFLYTALLASQRREAISISHQEQSLRLWIASAQSSASTSQTGW